MSGREFEYDLFFSYRHRPLDTLITQKLFTLAESYRLPDPLREAGYRQISRAFRDTEELMLSRVLTETIDAALNSADCLVVVCSPDTPSSDWVDREVAVFIERGRAQHIYPILIGGDPETSFPPSLKKVPDIAERTMDIRCSGLPADPEALSTPAARQVIRRMMEKARTEMLRVIADVANCEEEELVREEAFRRTRRRTRGTTVAIAVLALVTGISFGLLRLAQNYRDSAALHAEASMRILRELTYDLPDHLTNVPGAYSRIADILEANTEDLNAIVRLSPDRKAAEAEAAANYEKLANARSVLGMYEQALASEETALEIFDRLADGDEEAAISCASAWSNRGNILHSAGRYEEAAQAYEEAAARLRALAGGAETDGDPGSGETGGTLTGGAIPGDPRQARLLAQICSNAGANAADAGDPDRAEEAFSECLRILGAISAGDTGATETAAGDIGMTEIAAGASCNYGILLYRSGRYPEAQQQLEDACRLYEQLLKTTDSLQNRGSWLNAASALAACLTDQGELEEADGYYEEAIALAEELAQDDENLSRQRILADLCNNRGLCFNIRGLYDDAAPLYETASQHYRRIYDKTGAPSDGMAYAVSLLNTGENAFKAGEYTDSEEFFVRGLSVCESLFSRLGAYDSSQYHAWRSYYELIHKRDPEAAYEQGLIACRLQPDSVLANLNLAYACLYSGRYDECDRLFRILASLGEGQTETIRLDLRAQQAAGMQEAHIEEVLKILGE